MNDELPKLLGEYAARVIAQSGEGLESKWYMGEQGIDQATADLISQERADLIEELKEQIYKLQKALSNCYPWAWVADPVYPHWRCVVCDCTSLIQSMSDHAPDCLFLSSMLSREGK